MGTDEEELRAAAQDRPAPADMEALAANVSREGAVIDPAAGLVAVPLWTRGAPAGLRPVRFPR